MLQIIIDHGIRIVLAYQLQFNKKNSLEDVFLNVSRRIY